MLTIEQLLNKKQASGNKILSAARELPRYFITIHELAVERNAVASGKAVDVEVDIHCSVTLGGASSSKSKAQKSRHYHDMTYILTVTSDLDFVDFRRIPLSDPPGHGSFVLNLQNSLQYERSPRAEIVLCHSSTYEAEPKYIGLYVLGEPDLPSTHR